MSRSLYILVTILKIALNVLNIQIYRLVLASKTPFWPGFTPTINWLKQQKTLINSQLQNEPDLDLKQVYNCDLPLFPFVSPVFMSNMSTCFLSG